jgi:hypothetical protein
LLFTLLVIKTATSWVHKTPVAPAPPNVTAEMAHARKRIAQGAMHKNFNLEAERF